eukprot:TRINITY_DN34998_c0_g1_i1.p1 TRINITY_DN34998_c0_g1~~TRINITY_DN34998_c0_g1_i1.p1  ORF type:complete len:216 (-),score=50.66 TRINITY_DN34998_c0_g1_i1:91-738(-)
MCIRDSSNAALVVLCEGCDGFVGTMVCESVQGDSSDAPTKRSSVECLRSNFSSLHLVTSVGVGISADMLPSVLSERFDTEEDDIPNHKTVAKKQPKRQQMAIGAPNNKGRASSRMAEMEYDDETPSEDSDDDDDEDEYSKSEALRRLKSQGGEDWENGGVTVPRANRSKYNSVRDYLDDDSEDDSENTVSYTHLRAHETPEHLVCRLLLEKKKTQ